MGRFASAILLSLVGSARTISDRDERVDVEITVAYSPVLLGYNELIALTESREISVQQTELIADYDSRTAVDTKVQSTEKGTDKKTAEKEHQKADAINNEAVNKALAAKAEEERTQGELQQAEAAVAQVTGEVAAKTAEVLRLQAAVNAAQIAYASLSTTNQAATKAAEDAIRSALAASSISTAAMESARLYLAQCVADEQAQDAHNRAEAAQNASNADALEEKLFDELSALEEQKDQLEEDRAKAEETVSPYDILRDQMSHDLQRARNEANEAKAKLDKAQKEIFATDKWHEMVREYYVKMGTLQSMFGLIWHKLKEPTVKLGSKGLPAKASGILKDVDKALALGKETFNGIRFANYYKNGLKKILQETGNTDLISEIDATSQKIDEQTTPQILPFCKFWKLYEAEKKKKQVEAGAESYEEYKKSLLQDVFRAGAKKVMNLLKAGKLPASLKTK